MCTRTEECAVNHIYVDICAFGLQNRTMPIKRSKLVKVSVLFPPNEAARFDAYCQEFGYKKSTLIVRLVRAHLDREEFSAQTTLFDEHNSRRDKE